MIDTVHFRSHQSLSLAVRDRLGLTPSALSLEGEPRVRGGIGGMYASVGEWGTRVTGSLPRYLRGENLTPFSRDDVTLSIEKLADALEIPPRYLRESRLNRLDYGVNVVVPEPPSTYLRALRDPGSITKRSYLWETVTYGTDFQVEFYDKLVQMRRTQKAVWEAKLAEEYQGRQVLRIELRHKQRVYERFGQAVTLGDLDTEAFFADLGARVMSEVERFAGRHPVVTGHASDVRAMQLDQQRAGIEAQGGRDAILASIAEGRQSGRFTRSTAHRMRLSVEQALDAPSHTHWRDLGTELVSLTAEATARLTS